MNQKLTFNVIAATLAGLSVSSTLLGCGGSNPEPSTPVDAKEVPAATPGPEAAPSESTEHPAEGATDSAAAPATSGGEKPSDSKAAAEAPADSAAGADAKPEDKNAATKKHANKKAAGAKGSCGAGTCG